MPSFLPQPGNPFNRGLQLLNPLPVDSYMGPYGATTNGFGPAAGTTGAGICLANDTIPQAVRYRGQQVIILAWDSVLGKTLAYKYWYRSGTSDSDLELFSAGGGGAAFDATQSYTWTAPQYFSSGFSAAGGVTFTNQVSFYGQNTLFDSTIGDSQVTINGYLTTFGLTVGIGGLNVNDASGILRFTAGGISASGGATFAQVINALGGISASGATFGRLVVNSGISASGGATFANDVYVGGTLSVDGNFYVKGTLTTVNESQLLIQDKYLVLGSTLDSAALGVSAGIYIGSTTSPFASFAYNNTDSGRWVSNKPIYVNNDLVLTSTNISTQTGITAERVSVRSVNFDSEYSIPFTASYTELFAYRSQILLVDGSAAESGGNYGQLTYNPALSILKVGQVEAIIDGGTWGVP